MGTIVQQLTKMTSKGNEETHREGQGRGVQDTARWCFLQRGQLMFQHLIPLESQMQVSSLDLQLCYGK